MNSGYLIIERARAYKALGDLKGGRTKSQAFALLMYLLLKASYMDRNVSLRNGRRVRVKRGEALWQIPKLMTALGLTEDQVKKRRSDLIAGTLISSRMESGQAIVKVLNFDSYVKRPKFLLPNKSQPQHFSGITTPSQIKLS